MNTTDLLGVFRSEVSDLVAPYLWSDPLVYAYIDDAQKQFCRFTYGIDDSKSFTLSIVPATQWYAVDASILQIHSAYDSVTGDEIPVKTIEQLPRIRFNGSTGPLDVLVKGLESRSLRAYPVPNKAQTIWLRTWRLPHDVVAGSNFEIDAHHVHALLMWVKHRAYDCQDADGGDKLLAEENRSKFIAYCDGAKTEQGRLRRSIAVTKFGGIS